ncbi:hypothetical protein CSAL01_03243 [Colletotrichum salicis]|uniref:Uncharacterized protein n=1 Tax=Colletotrichum salicis TaxID=1209931 RepID=A0A135UZ04_9PEZI|nr:hypothetical protein CSAL01_03243 [Colletotrichum salicis]
MHITVPQRRVGLDPQCDVGQLMDPQCASSIQLSQQARTIHCQTSAPQLNEDPMPYHAAYMLLTGDTSILGSPAFSDIGSRFRLRASLHFIAILVASSLTSYLSTPTATADRPASFKTASIDNEDNDTPPPVDNFKPRESIGFFGPHLTSHSSPIWVIMKAIADSQEPQAQNLQYHMHNLATWSALAKDKRREGAAEEKLELKLRVIPKPDVPPSVGAGPASSGTSSLAVPLDMNLRRHQRHSCICTFCAIQAVIGNVKLITSMPLKCPVTVPWLGNFQLHQGALARCIG